MEKLTSGLTGIAGEYYVAAELSRRGFMASITLRNNDSIDIHASSIESKKLFAIQVKTTKSTSARWILNTKAEKNFDDKHFYVFVNLKELDKRPDFYIVSSLVVAERVRLSHASWLNNPGKKGQAHNDSSMRIFEDKTGEFLERWGLLE